MNEVNTMKITPTKITKNSKQESKAGKPYICHVVDYVEDNGENYSKKIMLNSPFADKLDTLELGKVADIKLEKKNGFWEWTGIKDAKSIAPSKKFSNDNIGMRVGNLTTNATQLVAAGVTNSLDEAVDRLIKLQERLEELLAHTDGRPKKGIKEDAAAVEVKDTPKETLSFEDLDEWESEDEE